MAKIYITEYSRLGSSDYAATETQSPVEPPLAEYSLTITGTSDMTPKFQEETRIVMISTDNICHISFGVDPSADTENTRLPADAIVFKSVAKASGLKVAAITGS